MRTLLRYHGWKIALPLVGIPIGVFGVVLGFMLGLMVDLMRERYRRNEQWKQHLHKPGSVEPVEAIFQSFSFLVCTSELGKRAVPLEVLRWGLEYAGLVIPDFDDWISTGAYSDEDKTAHAAWLAMLDTDRRDELVLAAGKMYSWGLSEKLLPLEEINNIRAVLQRMAVHMHVDATKLLKFFPVNGLPLGNSWELLGLKPGASKEEVRKAYHHLARSFHPDNSHGLEEHQRKQAEEALKRITEAYEKCMGRFND